jgi:hypothetical protein
LNSIRAEKAVAEAEHVRAIDELKAHHDKLNSDAKNQNSRGMFWFLFTLSSYTFCLDVMIRETLIIELREQIQAHNRENEISQVNTFPFLLFAQSGSFIGTRYGGNDHEEK